jgi:hypothetical protein
MRLTCCRAQAGWSTHLPGSHPAAATGEPPAQNPETGIAKTRRQSPQAHLPTPAGAVPGPARSSRLCSSSPYVLSGTITLATLSIRVMVISAVLSMSVTSPLPSNSARVPASARASPKRAEVSRGAPRLALRARASRFADSAAAPQAMSLRRLNLTLLPAPCASPRHPAWTRVRRGRAAAPSLWTRRGGAGRRRPPWTRARRARAAAPSLWTRRGGGVPMRAPARLCAPRKCGAGFAASRASRLGQPLPCSFTLNAGDLRIRYS